MDSQQPLDQNPSSETTNMKFEQSVSPSLDPNVPSPQIGNLLGYGGVTVAVIFALTYFCKVLLESITQLLKTQNKKTR